MPFIAQDRVHLSRGASVRPYLAFTGFTTDGQDYTLSNGMRADVGNTRILRAEAGTAVSYHMDLQNGTTLEP